MDAVDPNLLVAGGVALLFGFFCLRILWSWVFFLLKGALFLFFGGVVLTSAQRTFGPLNSKELQGLLAHASIAFERLYSELHDERAHS